MNLFLEFWKLNFWFIFLFSLKTLLLITKQCYAMKSIRNWKIEIVVNKSCLREWTLFSAFLIFTNLSLCFRILLVCETLFRCKYRLFNLNRLIHGNLNETDPWEYSVFHEVVATSSLLSLSPLSLSPLLSLPLSPLLALLRFPKCFNRTIFTEVITHTVFISSGMISPKHIHRNQTLKLKC